MLSAVGLSRPRSALSPRILRRTAQGAWRGPHPPVAAPHHSRRADLGLDCCRCRRRCSIYCWICANDFPHPSVHSTTCRCRTSVGPCAIISRPYRRERPGQALFANPTHPARALSRGPAIDWPARHRPWRSARRSAERGTGVARLRLCRSLPDRRRGLQHRGAATGVDRAGPRRRLLSRARREVCLYAGKTPRLTPAPKNLEYYTEKWNEFLAA